MHIRWLSEALQDLRDIHDYIAEENPQAARCVVGEIRKGTTVLGTAGNRSTRTPTRQPGVHHTEVSLYRGLSHPVQRNPHPARRPHIPALAETITQGITDRRRCSPGTAST